MKLYLILFKIFLRALTKDKQRKDTWIALFQLQLKNKTRLSDSRSREYSKYIIDGLIKDFVGEKK